MEIIAKKLGAPVVPYMGQFTIDEAIDFVRKGFKSTIAENPDYDAEGLVLKTPDGLMTRRGERIIFKIKTCDFKKYRAKYGTDAPIEQPQNPNYNGYYLPFKSRSCEISAPFIEIFRIVSIYYIYQIYVYDETI